MPDEPDTTPQFATLRVRLDLPRSEASSFLEALRGREVGGGRARIVSVTPDKPTPKVRDAVKEGEPTDRLTRICDAMTVALESHSEYVEGDIMAIIMLDSMEEKRGGLVLSGWDDSAEAMSHLFAHLKAVFAANGMTIQFHTVGEG